MGGVNGLNDGEAQLVHSSAGGQVKGAAVARLYMAQGTSWSYSNLWGAATLVASLNSDAHYIRLVDLQSGSVTWEQELYERFEYQAAAPFFHTFEGSDAVIGLSFADESDAATFHSAVASVAAGGAAPARPGGPPPVRRTTGPAPVAPSSAGRSPPATPPGPATPTAVTPTTTPPPSLQRAPSSAANLSASSPASVFSGTTSTGSKRMENKKKKGWFSRITEKMGLAEDDGSQDFVLSGPTGFRHESHIGWDPANGFEIRNIPPEWRKLFQAAGVKKSELRDATTAKFIMDTVAEATVGLNPTAAPHGGPPPPVPAHHAPPPAPGGPPPPPAPHAPPPPMAPMAPPPPSAPMAPPPPSFNAPGAPPPPAPAPSGGFGGSSLAAQLSSAQLKSVEDRALPSLNNLNEEQSHTLVDTLAKAMAARRVDMRVDDDELDSDDEWSD